LSNGLLAKKEGHRSVWLPAPFSLIKFYIGCCPPALSFVAGLLRNLFLLNGDDAEEDTKADIDPMA
jgi:hypothetical protein